MDHRKIQDFRKKQIKIVKKGIGVYGLHDVLGHIIYVGETLDCFTKRTPRHTTSARSDIIANRQIFVEDIAFISTFRVASKDQVDPLEDHLIHHFNDISPLMNGKLPPRPTEPLGFDVPEPELVQIMPDEVIAERKLPANMMITANRHLGELMGYIIGVKETDDTIRVLQAARARAETASQAYIDDYEAYKASKSSKKKRSRKK